MADWKLIPVDHDPFEGVSFESAPPVMVGYNYRDDVVNAALPVRRDPTMPDIVLQPEDSYGQQGYPPPHTGVLDEPAPPVERIPPSPWNRPKVDLEKGWYDSPNDPVSDEPPGPKYESDFLSPTERGFIANRRLVPVDHDPFADWFRKPSPAEIIGMGLPTFGGGSALGGFAQNTPAQSGFGGSQPSLSSMSPPGSDGSGGPPQQNNFRPPAGVSN